ncbi:hypothetical protein Voc01_083310 [Virgisporangium ochraceum]|uniref:DUF3500 domain-containing protein n=2 Tax=Virgisporangium ochraceum TaxID=65505 RepID=A0A8J4A046_9ACTN|nr:hypothetical protein Voc01_083310 [Virgisporangium ochraceum]
MRTAASALLTAVSDEVRQKVRLPFADGQRRWIEYVPMSRPGASLCELGTDGRKLAHRLLATALSPAAYAQAMAVMALEEVLDRAENWRRGRRSDDYSVVLFGGPDEGDMWGWRFEGHHLSVSMTLEGDRVAPTPVFLGANPARMGHAGAMVLRPLAPEEDVARALLAELEPKHRSAAIVADEPPPDIRSGRRADLDPDLRAAGVAASDLPPRARELMWRLLHVYLGRLPADLAAAETARIDLGRLHFAWEGSTEPGGRHYYRVQSPDLLIEYDNQDDGGNHAHTVLRRPGADFGDDILAEHRATSHA